MTNDYEVLAGPEVKVARTSAVVRRSDEQVQSDEAFWPAAEPVLRKVTASLGAYIDLVSERMYRHVSAGQKQLNDRHAAAGYPLGRPTGKARP